MTAAAVRRIASVRVQQDLPVSTHGLWKSILEGAARTAEFKNSTILILGKKDAGKASLIRELQKVGAGNRKLTPMELYGENNSVAALDYAYLNVRAMDDADMSECLAKSDVWILQDARHKHLLTQLLSPTHLRHLVVLLCLDLTEVRRASIEAPSFGGVAMDDRGAATRMVIVCIGSPARPFRSTPV